MLVSKLYIFLITFSYIWMYLCPVLFIPRAGTLVVLSTIHLLMTKLYLSDFNNQSVPHSEYPALVIKTDRLKLYTEIFAVCSQIHTKHVNSLWVEQRIC
jgi:hypothetical protein